MLAANPNLTADEVQAILQETADPIELRQAAYDPTGWSRTHGYGRVNAYRAVQEALR